MKLDKWEEDVKLYVWRRILIRISYSSNRQILYRTIHNNISDSQIPFFIKLLPIWATDPIWY